MPLITQSSWNGCSHRGCSLMPQHDVIAGTLLAVSVCGLDQLVCRCSQLQQGKGWGLASLAQLQGQELGQATVSHSHPSTSLSIHRPQPRPLLPTQRPTPSVCAAAIAPPDRQAGSGFSVTPPAARRPKSPWEPTPPQEDGNAGQSTGGAPSRPSYLFRGTSWDRSKFPSGAGTTSCTCSAQSLCRAHVWLLLAPGVASRLPFWCLQVRHSTQGWSQMHHRGAGADERTAHVPRTQCADQTQHCCVASEPSPESPLHLPTRTLHPNTCMLQAWQAPFSMAQRKVLLD